MLSTAYISETALCLVSVILCLLTGIILLCNSSVNPPVRFLGFSFLAFAYAFAIAALTYSHQILHVPHLYRTGNFGWLMGMPLSWLYVYSSITRKPLTVWHLLHLVPVTLYLIDYFPFFMSTAAGKVAYIHADMLNFDKLVHFRQGWLLPMNAQIPIRVLQGAVYWVLQIYLVFSPAAACLRRRAHWLKWIILYSILQLLLFLPNLIVLLTGKMDYFWASTVPPVVSGLLSAIALFFYPRLLYGNLLGTYIASPNKTKLIFDQAHLQRLTDLLERLMKEEKLFLNPNYTLRELADTVSIPPYKLSAYLNQITGKNFSDYLNQWRIGYCLELNAERKLTNLNLYGIATKCGFNNRNTFSAAFKRMTGHTPSVYLHSNA